MICAVTKICPIEALREFSARVFLHFGCPKDDAEQAAENSSMALSPPKASSAGLRARHAAKRDTAASTLIHVIVAVCTRWIRRTASGEAVCGNEAIHDIMALNSHGSRSKTSRTCRVPLPDPQTHRPRMR
jgi:hypothetical protein